MKKPIKPPKKLPTRPALKKPDFFTRHRDSLPFQWISMASRSREASNAGNA